MAFNFPDNPTSRGVKRDFDIDNLRVSESSTAPSIDTNNSTGVRSVLPAGNIGTTSQSLSLVTPVRNFVFSDGRNWIPLATQNSVYSSGPITGSGLPIPTWQVGGIAQRTDNHGYMTMRAVRTAGFFAQNPWVATLPVGIRPKQDLIGMPIFTNDFNSGTNQVGTVDITSATNVNPGQINNINITLNATGEYFDLNLILPL